MKLPFCCLLLLCLLSCSDPPRHTPTAHPRIVTVDSDVVKNENANPYVAVDVSPMDMSWLPADYPKMTIKRPLPVARLIYSRPHRQGRKIFGGLLKFGEPWRLGANEATEIEFFEPVSIFDKVIPRGRYVLYCIPYTDKWTLVLNSNLYSWGLTPDPEKDLYRFQIPVEVKDMSVEFFSMVFQETPYGADLVMAWDNVEARLPLHFTKR